MINIYKIVVLFCLYFFDMFCFEFFCYICEDIDCWYGYMFCFCYSYYSLNDMLDCRYVIYNLYVCEYFMENRI